MIKWTEIENEYKELLINWVANGWIKDQSKIDIGDYFLEDRYTDFINEEMKNYFNSYDDLGKLN